MFPGPPRHQSQVNIHRPLERTWEPGLEKTISCVQKSWHILFSNYYIERAGFLYLGHQWNFWTSEPQSERVKTIRNAFKNSDVDPHWLYANPKSCFLGASTRAGSACSDDSMSSPEQRTVFKRPGGQEDARPPLLNVFSQETEIYLSN